ncbi:MAG: hypothetical protein AAFX00_03980 [Pseudomonadota bacterium]
MNDISVFAGGLVRLLADHCTLKYEAQIFLWTCGGSVNPSLRATLRGNCDQLEHSIDCIGARLAEVQGRFPPTISELAFFSSIPQPLDRSTAASLLDGIRDSHSSIVDNIELLEAIIPWSDLPEDGAMLASLKALHAEAIVKLSAVRLADLH